MMRQMKLILKDLKSRSNGYQEISKFHLLLAEFFYCQYKGNRNRISICLGRMLFKASPLGPRSTVSTFTPQNLQSQLEIWFSVFWIFFMIVWDAYFIAYMKSYNITIAQKGIPKLAIIVNSAIFSNFCEFCQD